MTVSRPRRILRKLMVGVISLGWGRLPKPARGVLVKLLHPYLRRELEALDAADLVISTGGGYLNGTNSLSGNLNVWHLLLPIKLARQMGKPVVLAPQSYGPFGNDYQRRITKRVLDTVQSILVREGKSLKLLKEIGVNPALCVAAVDSGFAFDTDVTGKATNDKAKGMKVGITARAWMSKAKQDAYEQGLAGFIVESQRQHKAQFTLFPQVTSDLYEDDDRVCERRIAALARAEGATVEQVDDRPNHHALKRLYAGLDVTVGTRFHSVIFSLTSYVPAIAIEYEHKTSGIMQDLGLSDWVIKIEDVTAERLAAMYDRMTREHDNYVKHLRKVLPDYIARTEETRSELRRVFAQSSK
jgi:colanic acid/amylovoran biosynthesis protein